MPTKKTKSVKKTKSNVGSAKKVMAMMKAKKPAAKLKVTPPKVNKPVEPAPKVNAPRTEEQKNNIANVVNQSFEGATRIDHLPFNEQLERVFNPLHSITKTKTQDNVSESTYIVGKK